MPDSPPPQPEPKKPSDRHYALTEEDWLEIMRAPQGESLLDVIAEFERELGEQPS